MSSRTKLNLLAVAVSALLAFYGVTLLMLPHPPLCAITPSATAVDYQSEEIARPHRAALMYVAGGVMRGKCFGAVTRSGQFGWSSTIAHSLQKQSFSAFVRWVRIFALFMTGFGCWTLGLSLQRKKS